tara:strand:+ start:1092 stop:1520 length:429 start_codon:yes stop_codon:yes gene_type:complete
MKRILLIITGIVLMLPLSADCQEILVDRSVLIKVASQLDSFELLKNKQSKYLEFKDSCGELVNNQSKFINTQEQLIDNKDRQIDFLKQSQQEYKDLLKVNSDIINIYKKKTKIAKRNTVISLIGGGVLSVGLTTGLLITLIQ